MSVVVVTARYTILRAACLRHDDKMSKQLLD
jgi:hypothetical protein